MEYSRKHGRCVALLLGLLVVTGPYSWLMGVRDRLDFVDLGKFKGLYRLSLSPTILSTSNIKK